MEKLFALSPNCAPPLDMLSPNQGLSLRLPDDPPHMFHEGGFNMYLNILMIYQEPHTETPQQ